MGPGEQQRQPRWPTRGEPSNRPGSRPQPELTMTNDQKPDLFAIDGARMQAALAHGDVQ